MREDESETGENLEADEEEEVKNPFKWWQQEQDREDDEDSMADIKMPPDSLAMERYGQDDRAQQWSEDVAGAPGRGGTHSDQSGDSAPSSFWARDKELDKGDKDDKDDEAYLEIKIKKNIETAREGTQEPKSREFTTAASQEKP